MKTSTLKQPIHDLSQLDPDGFFTYADYLLWQFKERVELIRGRLLKISPAPNTTHQRLSAAFQYRLYGFFLNKTCKVFSAPFDVRLPVSKKKGQLTTVVQPDLCVICDPGKIDEKGCLGAPDLVVEILSPGNSQQEMHDKFDVYEEAGVREYWMVSPQERYVLVYVLNEKGKYIGLAPVTEDQDLRSAIFPELTINLKEAFA